MVSGETEPAEPERFCAAAELWPPRVPGCWRFWPVASVEAIRSDACERAWPGCCDCGLEGVVIGTQLPLSYFDQLPVLSFLYTFPSFPAYTSFSVLTTPPVLPPGPVATTPPVPFEVRTPATVPWLVATCPERAQSSPRTATVVPHCA